MRWFLLISVLLFTVMTAISPSDRFLNDLLAKDVLTGDDQSEATKALRSTRRPPRG